MLTLNPARQLLEECSFRIQIEKDKQGNWEFGTGFFITPTGFALTAFHNLPKRAVKKGRGRVKVFYRNLSKPLWLVWRPDLSDRQVDIAVLQLPKPGGVAFKHLTPAFLSPDLPNGEREEFWRDMTDLFVFGFPVRNVGKGSQIVAGQVPHPIRASVSPHVFGDMPEEDVHDNNNLVTIRRLLMDGNRINRLGGISGGAVLDAHTQWVVAVEGSYDPNATEENVFASELAQVVRKWKDAGERGLLDHLCEMRDRPPSLRRDLLAYLDALEAEANKTPVYYRGAQMEGVRVRVRVSPQRRQLDPAQMDEAERYAHRLSAEGGAEEKDWDDDVRDIVRRGTVSGDAGMGKTWLLKCESMRHARLAAQTLRQTSDPNRITLPIYCRLTDVAQVLAAMRTFSAAVVETLRGLSSLRLSERALNFIREQLDAQKCLLLLDAFDEVPQEQDQRENLLRAMSDWMSTHPSARVFLTSRDAGYVTPWRRENPDTEWEMTLLPFNTDQIGEFVNGFFDGDPDAARDLLDILDKDNAPQLRGMAEIPLLLGFLCALYREDREPSVRLRHFASLQKSDVCEACLRRLLSGVWRRVEYERPLSDAEVDDKLQLLEQVAFRLFANEGNSARQFSIRELRKVTQDASRDLYGQPLSREKLQEQIDDWCGDDSVLVKAGAGDNPPYLFLHLTFQEYLTACALAERANRRGWGEIEAVIAEKATRSDWQEVIKLLAGKLTDPDPLRQVLLNVIAGREGEAPAEPGGTGDAPAQPTGSAGASPSLIRVRREVAETLSDIGDTRFRFIDLASGRDITDDRRKTRIWRGEERGLILPTMVEIPAIENFTMGCDENDIRRYRQQLGNRFYEDYAQRNEKPRKVSIPAFAIAQYPVTVREFAQFVNSDGYTNRDYWIYEDGKEDGWQWVTDNGRTEPAYWNDSRFNKPNYPVVGVNWYEAVAYCNWLNAKMGQWVNGSMKSMDAEMRGRKTQDARRKTQHGRYRLPTEAEWEYAARGTERRLWAWGDGATRGELTNEELLRRCNIWTREGYVGNTTPVGIYPHGATPPTRHSDSEHSEGEESHAETLRSTQGDRIFDMVGNTWEWCEDWWDERQTHRVLRGGSWNSNDLNCRAALRLNNAPADRLANLGFRCAQSR